MNVYNIVTIDCYLNILRGVTNLSNKNEFYWRRLHSLLGVLPVGLFLVFHLSLNFTAVGGEESYNNAAGTMDLIPPALLFIIECIVIYIPILFHGIYGVFIAFTATPNNKRFGTFRNWMFLFQRITGVILVIFIAWHVFQTRIQKALGAEVNFDMMEKIVSNPFMLAFYIIGILSATLHLANGLWAFCVSWGITQSPKSQKVVSWLSMIFFVIVSVIGVVAILSFA